MPPGIIGQGDAMKGLMQDVPPTSKVVEAAVIGVSHPRWVERPLACVDVLPDAGG